MSHKALGDSNDPFFASSFIHYPAILYGGLLLLLPFTYKNLRSQNLSAYQRYKPYKGRRGVGIKREPELLRPSSLLAYLAIS